jgi:hypothetical protein
LYVHLFCLLGVLPLFAGCRSSTAADFGATDIALTVSPERPAVGPATLQFKLADKDGRPVAGATVRVEGTMTHAGMEPVKATGTADSTGQYTADFRFTMAGDWLVIAHVTLTDGSTSQRTLRVSGVTGGSGQGH